MRISVGVWAVAALAAVSAGCDGGKGSDRAEGAATAAPTPAGAPASAAASSSFVYSVSGDVFGYYAPTTDVAVGALQLTHLGLGQAQEFKDWAEGRRMETYAPVMFVFDDTSTPMVQTELGEAREVSERVMPQSFEVSEQRVRFSGRHPRLGEVAFDGVLDVAAARAANAAAGTGATPPTQPVLRGDLTAGGRTWDDVAFTWYGGD